MKQGQGKSWMGESENRDWESHVGVPHQHPCLAGLEFWVGFSLLCGGEIVFLFLQENKKKKGNWLRKESKERKAVMKSKKMGGKRENRSKKKLGKNNKKEKVGKKRKINKNKRENGKNKKENWLNRNNKAKSEKRKSRLKTKGKNGEKII